MAGSSNSFETAVRLHRPHPFYRNFEEGPFVYRCIGCQCWRQEETQVCCPSCGGSWAEIWEPPEHIREAISEMRRKPTIRKPTIRKSDLFKDHNRGK